ncbi:isoleucine--tRNA ligase, partial [Candidatus Micrarchaeota archaeon]|nr:isoleucine--tRNA ligase [Candidatus Micrarchaeota archaeon]
AEPHIGHVKTTACKDVWTKFHFMKGFACFLQPGFDCHGLPTEVMVEKELKITSKSDIEEKIGIAQFDGKCLEKAVNTEKKWIAYYKSLGAWRGYFEPYFTYKDYYIESAWWTAKQLHEKGLLVEGERSIHWCPRCETSLSGYEVSDSYKDIKAPSIYVKFKVKNADEFLLVWTTTPWTLPANVAIAVHPEEKYVRARSGKEVYILAKKRVESVEKETGKKFEVISEFFGSELDGLRFEPLLDLETQKGINHKIVLSIRIMANKKYKKHSTGQAADVEEYQEFVTMDTGTGLVHTAPGHGQTDNFVGKHYALPVISPVDEKGRFTQQAGQFAGMTTKKADPLIIEKLEQENKLFSADYFAHRAAVCWRCKTPLIFRVSKQWYYKIDPVKEKMLGENEEVTWLPEFGKTKFRNWIAEREDWCLSQQRYWGIPMPIWTCEKCGAHEVIGSRAELQEKSVEKLVEKNLDDLHRHVVDEIILKCSACGGKAKRIKDIFTVWFDSGVAPWASLGYPFRNKELFESMFPVSLINESQDQVRGWFDSLMLCSVGAFNKAPYKSVAMMGWVLDEKGQKMSKSLGNVVSAPDGIAKLGADAVRLYFCSEVAPWEVQNFSFEQAKKPKQALLILWNVYQFFETYRNGKEIAPITSAENLAVEDKWILSRLDSTTEKVGNYLQGFEFHLAGRELIRFIIEDLSRTYVKLVRDRLSRGEDKQCESVLLQCLSTTTKLLAPVSPFISEYIYRELKLLTKETYESIHFAAYPEPLGYKNEELEEVFADALSITEAANACRQEAGLKLRWPVREILTTGKTGAVGELQSVLQRLNNCEKISLTEKEPGEFVSRNYNKGKVLLSPKRDEELMLEANYREVIRSIQAGRKNVGLVVSDRVDLFIHTEDKKLLEYLKKKKSELAKHVGAGRVEFAPKGGEHDASVQVEGVIIAVRFTKV